MVESITGGGVRVFQSGFGWVVHGKGRVSSKLRCPRRKLEVSSELYVPKPLAVQGTEFMYHNVFIHPILKTVVV